MKSFNQKSKDYGHKMLDELITMTKAAAEEACNAGLDDARDKLYSGLGDLYKAKSTLGSVTGPEVSTRSGGEK